MAIDQEKNQTIEADLEIVGGSCHVAGDSRQGL